MSDAPSLFEAQAGRVPLASRMRPRSLDEVVGQAALLAPGRALRVALERGDPGSLLFWGPPGSGKTTLARLVAQHVRGAFVPFSAVTEGVPRLRELAAEAEHRRAGGTRTVLFVDEIHRFNKGQQDFLLPFVESGVLTLIGATTENPSFELNAALLSRLRVFVLEPLDDAALVALLRRALDDPERGLGALRLQVTDEALKALAGQADGDARRALTALEAASTLAGPGGAVDLPLVQEAVQRRMARYDKTGEQHYDLISALHKSLRDSDPHAALYWLARMLQGGEPPLYVGRRLVRFASEDVGLADPQALTLAQAGVAAFEFLGSPEGELALAEVAVYLATAPKSNRVYVAWQAAQAAARRTPAAPVPLHLRNAVTALMKDLGFGAGYEYAPDAPHGVVNQRHLPHEVGEAQFYEPGRVGFEREIAKRLAWWAGVKRRSDAPGVG